MISFQTRLILVENKIHTISSKVPVPALLRREHLLDEWRDGVTGGEAMLGVAAGVRLFIVAVQTLRVDTGVKPGEGADSRAGADAFVVQDEESKFVCVEVVFVQGFAAGREGWGGGEHVEPGFVVADGRSEAREAARGSGRQVTLWVKVAGEGGEDAGGRGDCDVECNDVGRKKERGDDGDKHPASSFSISLSSLTSPGGSTPYLKVGFNKNACAFIY